MMIYLATDSKNTCQRVTADSWEAAEDVCRAFGWRLDGELVCEIDADKATPQMIAEFCEQANGGVKQ